MDFLDELFPQGPPAAPRTSVGTRKRARPTDDWWNELDQLPDLVLAPRDLSTPEAVRAAAEADHRAMYHERLNKATRKRSGRTPEAQTTKDGNKWLASLGIKMIRINQGTFKVVDPDGDTRIISGPPAGTHDWVGCLPTGRFISVEYKATTDPTDGQLAFQRDIQTLGGLSLVVYDIDRDLKPAVEAELARLGKDRT